MLVIRGTVLAGNVLLHIYINTYVWCDVLHQVFVRFFNSKFEKKKQL